MKMEPAKSFVADNPLRRLGYHLRHPETWPDVFVYDYCWEKTCAIGLAYRLGMIGAPIGLTAMYDLGLSTEEARAMFYAGCGRNAYTGKVEVTAAMVADRIDAYLGRTEITAAMVADRIDAVLAREQAEQA